MVSERGFTVWLTGLPCAGKSTIARLVASELRARGRALEVLDGDEVRTNLSKGLGYSRADRDTNVLRIAYVAELLNRHGVSVVVAAVSPYESTRRQVRERLAGFVEVYVDCPVAECERRDDKGMYARARAGQIEHFTGVGDPYEPPKSPELVLPTESEAPAQSAQRVLRCLRSLGYLRGPGPLGRQASADS